MSSIRFVSIVLALVLVPGLLSAQSEPVLAPGDSIRIMVFGDMEMEISGMFEIRPDGSIGHPYYREVQVAGLPISQVEQRVYDYIATFEVSPRVVVDPMFRVSVGGEVREPGVYSFGVGTTVTEALLRAGGPTEDGADRVILFRNGQRIVIDATQPDPTMGGMEIRSGDQLVVPEKVSVFRNYVVPFATITGAVAAVLNVILDRR